MAISSGLAHDLARGDERAVPSPDEDHLVRLKALVVLREARELLGVSPPGFCDLAFEHLARNGVCVRSHLAPVAERMAGIA